MVVQAVSLYRLALSFVDEGDTPDAAAERAVKHWTAHHGKYMPGFGHRFHTRDPRATRLMELVKIAQDNGVVSGRSRGIALQIEEHLSDSGKFFYSEAGRAMPFRVPSASMIEQTPLVLDAMKKSEVSVTFNIVRDETKTPVRLISNSIIDSIN